MIEIIGKNGAGKSYLANKLYNLGFKRNIGYTTRPMREQEIDGIDYYFISEKQFEEMMKKNELIDHKFRNGFYYGISKNNMDNNTILVSGDTKKIEAITGYKILKLYVDCDFITRYLRVLERNESIDCIFDRFHTENFSYLYDFDAIFINNDLKNEKSLEKNIVTIMNNDLTSQSLISNRTFIEKEVEKFDMQLNKLYEQLLILLRYEEYLLRKLFLKYKKLYDNQVAREYYDAMISFMDLNHIEYSIEDNELYAFIDYERYKFDYKIKRRVKR